MALFADQVAVVGVGQTPYTRAADRPTVTLALDAISAALDDAGLHPGDVDAVFPPYAAHRSATVEDLVMNLGMDQVTFRAVFYMGGASAVASVGAAVLAIGSGVSQCAVVFRARKGASGRRATARALEVLPNPTYRHDLEVPYGFTSPVHWYALVARRHMIEYGTTSEHFGAVAMTQRRHAQLNAGAQMHGRPMTVVDYEQAPMIAEPYRLFDCSLETDGACAIVLTSVERARDLRQTPVTIGSVAQGHPPSPDDLTNRRPFLEAGTRPAGRRALADAETSVQDLDLAMIYDPFTGQVLIQLEQLGICDPGQAGDFVLQGNTGLGGSLPVNTHGGLLSEGHLSGLNHVIEGVRQLRGDVGDRQVVGAEQALVTGWGDLGDAAVAVLRRPR